MPAYKVQKGTMLITGIMTHAYGKSKESREGKEPSASWEIFTPAA